MINLPVRTVFRARILPIFLIFSLLHSLQVPVVPPVQAANLAEAMLRLDRVSNNTPLSGIACARPANAGAATEGRVSITFPADFTVSTSPAQWTTGTTGLPSDSTPWPDISVTALGVSGKTVTFSGDDLTTNVLYCFSFSGGSSTTGNTGPKTGTIATATSGGAPIDSRQYGMTVTDDRIGVTARVGTKPTDYTVTLTKITPQNTFGENERIEYEIEYGTTLPTQANFTLEATWSLGTIDGENTPTVNTLRYDPGSAGSAHNNAPAVINPVERKISWTITQFPPDTTKTVRFALRTNDGYRDTLPVSFDVQARILDDTTATTYSIVTSTYLYRYSASAGGPTGTPGASTPDPSPTPTPVSRFQFQDVFIRAISQNSAVVTVLLSQPASLSVAYGSSPLTMTERLVSLNRSSSHRLTFSQLDPDTAYYFRITGIAADGKRITSDLYTFTTAKISKPLTINPDTFIVTSEKNLIFSFLDKERTDGRNYIILPPNTLFEAQFAFEEGTGVRDVSLFISEKTTDAQGDRVLGMNTFADTAVTSDSTPLLQIKPGVFTGRLTSNRQPGEYEINIRVHDENGNITEEKVADLKVSKPFLILFKDTNQPVENAKVTLSLFNQSTRTYEVISSQMLPIQNPVYSEANGEVPVILPMGRYRAEIEEPRNKKQTVEFSLGPGRNEKYPTVFLPTHKFTLVSGTIYLLTAGIDLFRSFTDYLGMLTVSKRVLDLSGILTLLIFFFFLLLALREKTHVRFLHFPGYFRSLLHRHTAMEKDFLYRGIILDGHEKSGVPGVSVFVTDTATGEIVYHTTANHQGKFRIPLPQKDTYTVTLEKIAYHPVTLPLKYVTTNEEQTFALIQADTSMLLRHTVVLVGRSLLGMSFELLLLISVIILGSFITSFGFIPVLPFFFLALFNVIFWMLYMLHHYME